MDIGPVYSVYSVHSVHFVDKVHCHSTFKKVQTYVNSLNNKSVGSVICVISPLGVISVKLEDQREKGALYC